MSASADKSAYSLAASRLDETAEIPLYRQIYRALRTDILDGLLLPGQRLAATRTLATELGVSRNTVVEAVEQLVSEGYLVSKVGAGTHVSDQLPEEMLKVDPPTSDVRLEATPLISSRGAIYSGWAERSVAGDRVPFQLGRPAVEQFPWREWNRISARLGRDLPRDWLDYSDSAGYLPLREELTRYLYSARGLRCSPEQVVIVRGSQQGLDLAARVLLDSGDRYWMEDPGYQAARVAFQAAGACEVAVPVDPEGLDVDTGRRLCERARLAYVTPSHQFPLGVTMSLRRRFALLEWASDSDSWIVEDDYDSEYRFEGRPLESLASLDEGSHVIYLGTLSKVLFPALRLGYLVVPIGLVDAFVGARYASDRATAILEQAVVTEFFSSGQLGRHLRKMRLLYAHRETVLREAIRTRLDSELELARSDAGLHSVARLKRGLDDVAIAARAAEVGVTVSPLSSYCRRSDPPSGLVLGYAGFPDQDLTEAVERLAAAFERR